MQRLVDELLAGAQALQSGHLDYRLPVVADTEGGRVAAAFNALAGALQLQRSQAQAELQIVEARQRQFLEDVSHELRTPATAIRGEAEIALRGPEKPVQEYKLALQRVISIVQQMAVLIDEVLLLARVEAEQQMLRRGALAWVEALRETARLAEALGHEQQVEIRFEPQAEGALDPADPLLADADPVRLRQALMVVLDNAVRYSWPRGVVTVAWAAGPDSLEAIVRDRGVGIDPAELPSLFMRYARGARARAHRADGSGLGLAIAQTIVHAHGGRIGIESGAGAGTTVRIGIPRWCGEPGPAP
jgi:signal transduction histidine kinase